MNNFFLTLACSVSFFSLHASQVEGQFSGNEKEINEIFVTPDPRRGVTVVLQIDDENLQLGYQGFLKFEKGEKVDLVFNKQKSEVALITYNSKGYKEEIIPFYRHPRYPSHLYFTNFSSYASYLENPTSIDKKLVTEHFTMFNGEKTCQGYQFDDINFEKSSLKVLCHFEDFSKGEYVGVIFNDQKSEVIIITYDNIGQEKGRHLFYRHPLSPYFTEFHSTIIF